MRPALRGPSVHVIFPKSVEQEEQKQNRLLGGKEKALSSMAAKKGVLQLYCLPEAQPSPMGLARFAAG